MGWETYLSPGCTGTGVWELQEKATRKEDSSWKTAAPVSHEQAPRRSRWADLISDPLEGISDSRVQKVSDGYSTQD